MQKILGNKQNRNEKKDEQNNEPKKIKIRIKERTNSLITKNNN